jgi:hypothetical protein
MCTPLEHEKWNDGSEAVTSDDVGLLNGVQDFEWFGARVAQSSLLFEGEGLVQRWNLIFITNQ